RDRKLGAPDEPSRDRLRPRDGQARRHAIARRDAWAIVGSRRASIRKNLLELAILRAEDSPATAGSLSGLSCFDFPGYPSTLLRSVQPLDCVGVAAALPIAA